MDGDGEPDVVTGNVSGSNRLYVNLHRQLHAPLLAIVGRDYELDFYARPGYTSSYHRVVPFVATAENETNLPPLGRLGLDMARTVVLPLLVIAPSTGKTTLTLELPKAANLVGTPLFSQALIIPDLANPPRSWRLTNVTADRIIR